MRKISYVKALNEALYQKLETDERVFLIGQGVTSPWYVGNSTIGLVNHFGRERIIDVPVSESSIAGVAVGAALEGRRPILLFPRMDFMYYAMDAIANHAANWHYMFGGQVSVPLTIWAIINRGGEQAAQHSQALQAIFLHIPGLKVVMPSTPYDVKGLLNTCINDNNPVVFIDDRWLYNYEGDVPEEEYFIPLGKGEIIRQGNDLTIVASSYMVYEAMKAAEQLKDYDISVELINLRTLKPLDEELLLNSVKKTSRLIIVDGGWRTCGVSAELSALMAEKAFAYLRAPIMRVTLPDAPAPASLALEKSYYPRYDVIVSLSKKVFEY